MEVSRRIVDTGGHSPPVYVDEQESLPGLAPEPVPVQQTLPGFPYVPTAFMAEGKEVLRDGVHYADAVDPDAASCIARAMNADIAQAEWACLLSRVK